MKLKFSKIISICIFFTLTASVSAQKGQQYEAKPQGGFTKNISGTWDCGDFGKLTLKQNGISVTGVYDNNGGSLRGTITGNTFSGVWSESETGDSGAFEFELAIKRMSPDPTHLDGKWNHTNDRKWQTGWNCVK
ncbi:hypothetical protein EHQ16_10900 [Leptospira kanakyensis]|uniref:Secreted protein n=1 Tax=Leptospira kanakyensis TaxID=2484968 RepID=A0A6N4PV41_9LEPT|nr:hypothetical protein [Leptospira kanakyensis]TGK49210.1 hypothetical protein EHQ11_14290 [Leptospira kanakyensis]TGK60549.1 hypothetical protein EHQ16_10900 [Leptospira kanakyensis]TGK67949.1 hypothetical protein EHQ18_15700 [Leptospira kanakyensis]